MEIESKSFELEVSGLSGGHSGADIHLNRGNGIKILSDVLWEGLINYDLKLTSINAGSASNAIPRDASAIITVAIEKSDAFENSLNEIKKNIINKFPDEKKLKIELKSCNVPEYVLDNETKWGLLSALYFCPNGIIVMSKDMEDLVETSNNLAIVETQNNQILVKCLIRSSVDSSQTTLEKIMEDIFDLSKAETEIYGQYSGWKPNLDSQILKIMKETYYENFGKNPKVKAIHAGLECGVLGEKYPNWDMISFGPTIEDPHTPDERVNIESVEKFWKLLIKTLKKIPNSS